VTRTAVIDIREAARRNSDYRRVIHTGALSQLVVMMLPPFTEIGEERHETVEQTFFIVEGVGTLMINRSEATVLAGEAVVVPPGTTHNLKAGRQPLRLFTIYTPPNHIDGTVHRTRADAEADVEDQAFGHKAGRARRA